MTDKDALKLDKVQFLTYQLKKHQVNYATYILLKLNSKGFEHAPKEYNSVARPAKNLIMLLGSEGDLDVKRWAQTILHEILNFVLYYFGIEDQEISEQIVGLLES